MTDSLLQSSVGSALESWSAWVLVAAAYLVGAIPFGYLIARAVKDVDLRKVGSGNIGTMNTMRALGRGWGLVVFALDFLKGCLPVYLADSIVRPATTELALLQVVVGTAAVLGHCYPVYLRFRGGKGVATGCGAIVAVEPLIFVAGGCMWALTRLLTGYAGLASILMGLTFPIAAWFLMAKDQREIVIGAALLTFLIVVRHRSNIQRMMNGTEPRSGRKPNKGEAARHG